MGSKNRIAKYLLPIIQERIKDNDIHTFIDCFVGGANIIDKVECEQKIGSDNNKYLIALFQNLDKIDSLPEIVTKEEYNKCRDCYYSNSGVYPDWYIGAIGFLASYSGRFYEGGFNGTSFLNGNAKRNYYDEAKKNLLKQIPSLNNIIWKCGDYKELYSNVTNCCIYCDIPYKGTKQYSTSINFDYDRFWDWAHNMSLKNIVLVSEYNAPTDWKCIWHGNLKKTMNYENKIDSVEKLFEFKK